MTDDDGDDLLVRRVAEGFDAGVEVRRPDFAAEVTDAAVFVGIGVGHEVLEAAAVVREERSKLGEVGCLVRLRLQLTVAIRGGPGVFTQCWDQSGWT